MPDNFDLSRVRAVEPQSLGSLRVYGVCRARSQHRGDFLVVESQLEEGKSLVYFNDTGPLRNHVGLCMFVIGSVLKSIFAS